jgi:hypothetical protein
MWLNSSFLLSRRCDMRHRFSYHLSSVGKSHGNFRRPFLSSKRIGAVLRGRRSVERGCTHTPIQRGRQNSLLLDLVVLERSKSSILAIQDSVLGE